MDSDIPATIKYPGAAELADMLGKITFTQQVWHCANCGRQVHAGMMCGCAWQPWQPVAQIGWTCPQCGAVWAPHVAGCERCNSK